MRTIDNNASFCMKKYLEIGDKQIEKVLYLTVKMKLSILPSNHSQSSAMVFNLGYAYPWWYAKIS
jgi:hypothetical protein